MYSCIQLLIYPCNIQKKKTFLVLNNRHWQEMDNWVNVFILCVKYEYKFYSVYKTSTSCDAVCLNFSNKFADFRVSKIPQGTLVLFANDEIIIVRRPKIWCLQYGYFLQSYTLILFIHRYNIKLSTSVVFCRRTNILPGRCYDQSLLLGSFIK